MNKIITLIFILTHYIGFSQSQAQEEVIARLGQVSFFSYTSVENIEATNNQSHSIIDLSNGEIAVSILLRAFVFKKALMEEHFNESYVESDIYPKIQLHGNILDFDSNLQGVQTKIVKGTMSFHGVNRDIEIKTKIDNTEGSYILSGDFEVNIKDYEIKVPPLLARNIAKTIKVTFRFEYQSL
ncbi:YceI family protein [Flavobacteriaceae bacterium R38]|nr:YceI family protein [Flavobacteriaceae bacterium R38]